LLQCVSTPKSIRYPLSACHSAALPQTMFVFWRAPGACPAWPTVFRYARMRSCTPASVSSSVRVTNISSLCEACS
jgi:hypothetical protein